MSLENATQFDIVNKEAFIELQKQLLSNNKTLKATEALLLRDSREQKRISLTLSEIEKLPASVKLYRPTGRMFLESERETLKADMENQLKSLASEVEALKKKKEYHQAKLIEAEKGIAELMSQQG